MHIMDCSAKNFMLNSKLLPLIVEAVLLCEYLPEIAISDNGPQHVSWEMKQFARQYGFNHITSSPHYPQSNGLAERAVQTVMILLKQAEDPWMNYSVAPLLWWPHVVLHHKIMCAHLFTVRMQIGNKN